MTKPLVLPLLFRQGHSGQSRTAHLKQSCSSHTKNTGHDLRLCSPSTLDSWSLSWEPALPGHMKNLICLSIPNLLRTFLQNLFLLLSSSQHFCFTLKSKPARTNWTDTKQEWVILVVWLHLEFLRFLYPSLPSLCAHSQVHPQPHTIHLSHELVGIWHHAAALIGLALLWWW